MATTPTADPAVFNNPSAHRYEIHVDDELAGVASYSLYGDTVVVTHTKIADAFEGRGLGSQLAKAALDDVRLQGQTVRPLCPFFAEYIQRHPAYADLVVDAE